MFGARIAQKRRQSEIRIGGYSDMSFVIVEKNAKVASTFAFLDRVGHFSGIFPRKATRWSGRRKHTHTHTQDGHTRMRERVRRVHTRMYERAVPSTPRTCNMLPSACVLCECVTAIALGYNKRQGEPRCRAASLLSSTTRVPSPGYGLWRNTVRAS